MLMFRAWPLFVRHGRTVGGSRREETAVGDAPPAGLGTAENAATGRASVPDESQRRGFATKAERAGDGKERPRRPLPRRIARPREGAVRDRRLQSLADRSQNRSQC